MDKYMDICMDKNTDAEMDKDSDRDMCTDMGMVIGREMDIIDTISGPGRGCGHETKICSQTCFLHPPPSNEK